MKRLRHGFTIVELMIATLVFSVILVIVATSVITFSRQFYKGRVVNNTQNVTRTAINEVSQTLQFGNGTFTAIPSAESDPLTKGYCINGTPYYFVLGRRLGDGTNNTTKAALITTNNGCAVTKVPNIADNGIGVIGGNARELLGQGMWLSRFDIVHNGSLNTVALTVAYGDNDLLCAPSGAASGCTHPSTSVPLVESSSAQTLVESSSAQTRCAPGSGNEYCAVVRLTSGVAKRIN